MYLQVWTKYMPVIRIMLKRAVNEPQLLKLNRIDFDKAGGGKKVGYRFIVEIRKGKLENRISSQIAKDLLTVLQQDAAAMKIMIPYHYELEMNPKCELSLTRKAGTGIEVFEESPAETAL
jgi:hypothetical protein